MSSTHETYREWRRRTAPAGVQRARLRASREAWGSIALATVFGSWILVGSSQDWPFVLALIIHAAEAEVRWLVARSGGIPYPGWLVGLRGVVLVGEAFLTAVAFPHALWAIIPASIFVDLACSSSVLRQIGRRLRMSSTSS